MRFEVQSRQGEWTLPEYAVLAVDPKSGNDTALLGVFEAKAAAEELAAILNHAALLLSWHRNPETMGK